MACGVEQFSEYTLKYPKYCWEKMQPHLQSKKPSPFLGGKKNLNSQIFTLSGILNVRPLIHVTIQMLPRM